MNRARADQKQEGFSLIELLVSVLIFLIIITITFSLFTSSLRVSKGELTIAYRDEAVKSALALMESEIQQAGSHPDTPTPASRIQGVTGVGTQYVTVVNDKDANPLRGINVGDKLTIYDPSGILPTLDNNVEVTAIDPKTNRFQANFALSHPDQSPIVSIKQPFRTGILSNSSARKLRFFGDIFDNGQLYYVEYTYDKENQRLLRAVELVDGVNSFPNTAPFQSGTDRTLLRNLLPIGPIFQYIADDQGNIVSVIITLRVGSGDPSDQNPLTLTTTVTARNVTAASTLTRTNDITANNLPKTPNWITFMSTRRPDPLIK